MKDQKKSGILLSYFNIALSMAVNMVLTPMLITALSDETYSIYKVMQSLAGPLAILNLGLGTIAARCVARCREAGDAAEKENTLAIALLVAGVMAAAVLLVAALLTGLIPRIYGANYSAAEIQLAKRLFAIFALSAAVNIVTDVFRGYAVGRERFVFHYGTRTLHYLLKLGLTVLCLRFGAVGAALADLTIHLAVLLLYMAYALGVLRERPRLHRWDRRELGAIFSFSAAVLLQAVVNQVNNNVDLMILGAMVEEKRIITMYSAALSIYVIYNSMISVFSGVFFPKAVGLVERDCSGEELTDFVIGPGRIQAMIAVGILGGFGLFGGDFVELWIGPEYGEARWVALALMVPMTIPLVQNVCLSILDARLKRMFRSVMLCAMAALNVAVSVLLVPVLGFWGAALGTVLSLTAGHGIIMNRYYRRALGLNVGRMFREIFRGTLPCGIGAGALCLPLTLLPVGLFLLKCLIFCGVYGALLWRFGWNQEEKTQIGKLFGRRSYV